MRQLNSNGVADPNDPAVAEQMRSKHPQRGQLVGLFGVGERVEVRTAMDDGWEAAAEAVVSGLRADGTYEVRYGGGEPGGSPTRLSLELCRVHDLASATSTVAAGGADGTDATAPRGGAHGVDRCAARRGPVPRR